jgi:hypothetical protein
MSPLFIRIIRLRKGTRLFHTAPSIDIDEATHRCRVCECSWIVNCFRRGIVVGWWQPSDMRYDEAVLRFMRCGLKEEPSVNGRPESWERFAPGGTEQAAGVYSCPR